MPSEDDIVYSPEMNCSLLCHDVFVAVDRVRQISKNYGHIVKGELPVLREAADKLAELIAALADQS